MGRTLDEPRLQRMAGAVAQRDDAVAIALAVTHDDLARAVGELQVAAVKRGNLPDPQAGPQQYLHDRAIACVGETVDCVLQRAQLGMCERARTAGWHLDASDAGARKGVAANQ